MNDDYGSADNADVRILYNGNGHVRAPLYERAYRRRGLLSLAAGAAAGAAVYFTGRALGIDNNCILAFPTSGAALGVFDYIDLKITDYRTRRFWEREGRGDLYAEIRAAHSRKNGARNTTESSKGGAVRRRRHVGTSRA
jgi:hypothetical protein